jgi:hypothetical protein
MVHSIIERVKTIFKVALTLLGLLLAVGIAGSILNSCGIDPAALHPG